MRKEPIWYRGIEEHHYFLTGLQTCKEQLLAREDVSIIQIIRYYTETGGKHLYGVVVWHKGDYYRDISTSVGAALLQEYSWTIDKLRTSWEPRELAHHLCERMAQAPSHPDEKAWGEHLQPRENTLFDLWSCVRIFDAYNEN